MSKVIAVNAGSSSLKFQLFEMDNETVITSGVIERIGMEDSIFTIKYNGEKDVRTLAIPTHKEAVHLLLDTLMEKNIVTSLDEIKGVGHRVVQGGSYFKESAIIDEDVVNKIDEAASSCSACDIISAAIYLGFAPSLAIIKISLGPATISIPTTP